MYFSYYFFSIFMNLIAFSSYSKPFDLLICTIFCVGRVIGFLMSFSDGFHPCLLRRKMEKARSMRKKWMERCFFPARFGMFFVITMIKVLFAICTLIWRINIYVSCQRKG